MFLTWPHSPGETHGRLCCSWLIQRRCFMHPHIVYHKEAKKDYDLVDIVRQNPQAVTSTLLKICFLMILQSLL